MTKWENASKLRKLSDTGYKKTRLGSINDIGWNITDDEARWLINSSEASGVSVAEFLSGIVKDAYWEEHQE